MEKSIMQVDFYDRILRVTPEKFEALAMEIFKLQATFNVVYKEYIFLLKKDVNEITRIEEIPFLPIELYKNQDIKTGEWNEQFYFLSSGTSNSVRSRNPVKDLAWYSEVVTRTFLNNLPDLRKAEKAMRFVAYLPGYIENPNSSLVMMLTLLARSFDSEVIFISNKLELISVLKEKLNSLDQVVLFGVSFALYDFAKEFTCSDSNLMIIETGGMKTDSREITKDEIYNTLKNAFSLSDIYSEYGMTELMSQAYSKNSMNYHSPAWMKVIVTAADDPGGIKLIGKRGRVHVIDLANIDTCCFLQTGDAGISNEDGSFQVLGRLQDDELRGCNLMIGE
ncbi:MAG: acyl transferase [Saprospiraceae bacterium]|nr:acyl transferase [Saprospiraceae bacterium]